MDRNRLLMIGAVVAVVVVSAVGFVVGVNPQLKAAEEARAQGVSATQQNETLRSGLVTLQSKFTKMGSLSSELAELKKSVPVDAGSPTFIDEINALANTAGVSVKTLALSDAQAYVPPVTAAPTTTTTATSAPSTSPSPAAAAAAPALPVAPAVVTDALITGSNFSVIPITITVAGTYAQSLGFLAALHGGDRLVLVTSFGGSADSSVDGTSGTWTVGGYIYALADAATAQTQQQQSASTAADSNTATDSSSTDTAAGK